MTINAKTLGNIGRPRKIQTPERFDELVDAYIAVCEEEDEPLTLTGLVLYMGFNAISSFDNYGRREGFEEFEASVKRARMLVQHDYEKGAKKNGAGSMFLLKASYGYRDRAEVDVNAKGTINLNVTGKDAKL